MASYPKVDDHLCLFAVDAGSVADDDVLLSGPAPSPPSNPGVDPWDGPYGLPVTEWKEATHPGYGTDPEPTKSWKVDVQLPDGWYTRISRRDKWRG